MADLSSFGIYEKPENQRIWLVRAEGGEYLPHFRKGGVIAVGYINNFITPSNHNQYYLPNKVELEKEFIQRYKTDERSNERSARTHFNQTVRFIEEMNIGDLVLTPDFSSRSRLQVGRITGHPTISKDTIDVVVDASTGRTVYMDYQLQRNVVWGPFIDKSRLPLRIQSALRAQQSVSNLDDHWESIYHSLYPFFTHKENLYFSVNIQTPSAINNYAISQFFSFLSEAEAIAKYYSEGDDLNLESAASFLSKAIADNNLELFIKASFMSEGNAWGKFPFGDNSLEASGRALWFYLIISAVFGSEKLGWDGVVDLETRQAIFGYIGERFKQTEGFNILENLELEQPRNNTKMLEDDSNDTKDFLDL